MCCGLGSPGPRHSWLASRVCVFGYGFWLRPANFGWCLQCVCLGLDFSCTRLFLAGLLGRVPPGTRSARTRPLLGGAACVAGLCGGRCGRGFSPPPLLFSSGLPGCGGGFCGCGSRPRCVVALWWSPSPVPVLAPLVPAPPPPFLWVPPFCFLFFAVSVSVWPVACHFSRGGVRQRVWGVFWSGPSAAVWSWWAAFSRRASSGWAGWSRGVLSAGLLAVAFGVAWQGSFPPSVEWVRGFAVVRLSSPFSFFPAFCFFFPGRVACSSLRLPWAGARTGLQTVWLPGSLLALWVAAGRVLALYVLWFMYTHGLVAHPVGLGSGSASWAVAPARMVRSWV